MSEKTLFDTYTLGDLKLKNRIVMAAMTRGRSDPNTGAIKDIHVTYYEQRASAGLILTEASPISHQGNPHLGAACIYNEEHIVGWKKVVDAVHKKGAKIFIQLWHGGRACKSADTKLPILAPSALPMKNYDKGNVVLSETPTEASVEDIKKIVEEFVNAAKCAKEAGFDGVEIHGANGYLIDQFLRSESNKRTDDYGGSVAKRCKLALDVTDAVLKVWPADRVGFKFSPVGRYNYMYDENPVETFSHLLVELSKRKLGFVEITEAGHSYGKSFFKSGSEQIAHVAQTLRKYFSGTYISNEGYTAETGLECVKSGNADLISYAKAFISNPDFPHRIRLGLDLNNNIDWSTGFFGDAKGYTDYPKHEKNDIVEQAEEDDKREGGCCNIF